MLILIFGSKSGFGEESDAKKNTILRRFLAEHLLEIALPWQQLGSQAIKTYLTDAIYVNTKSPKVSASYPERFLSSIKIQLGEGATRPK